MQDDLISRQAVMDCFKKWQPYMASRLWDFEQELSALPSISPQPCEDAISRQAVNNLQKYRYNCGDTSITCISLKSVNDLSSVNPQEKTGHWIKYGKLYQCSECKELSCCQGKFCNECGVKMVEPQERSGEE